MDETSKNPTDLSRDTGASILRQREGASRETRERLIQAVLFTSAAVSILTTIGIVAVTLYISVGVFLGGLAGYFGGWIDDFLLFLALRLAPPVEANTPLVGSEVECVLADVAGADPAFVGALGLDRHLSPTRSNGLAAMIEALRHAARQGLAA